jgi:hypothetical protein
VYGMMSQRVPTFVKNNKYTSSALKISSPRDSGGKNVKASHCCF